MDLSFLILAHKNPRQLQLLVDHLLNQDCAVFVHIDKEKENLFSNFKKVNSDRSKLYIYSKYNVQWGRFSQILATFFLLQESVRIETSDFYTLLSGQDLPIKPISDFKNFLDSKKQYSFMTYYQLPAHDKLAGNGGLDRMELFWLPVMKRLGGLSNKLNVVLHKVQNVLKMKRQSNFPLFAGSNWFILNREMALYAVDFIADNKQFLRRFRFTRLSDEIILQTILLNSKYNSKIVNENYRHVEWDDAFLHPKILTIHDRENLLKSDSFFARKFDETVDMEIIQLILSTH